MVRVALGFYALVFIVFGVRSFFDPDTLVQMLGAETIASDGRYELRGIYGGVSFGAGLLCAAGVFKSSLQRPALYFLLAYTGGYVLSRIAALPLDGVTSPQFLAFSAFEAVTALVSAVLLWRLSKQRSGVT